MKQQPQKSPAAEETWARGVTELLRLQVQVGRLGEAVVQLAEAVARASRRLETAVWFVGGCVLAAGAAAAIVAFAG